MDANTIMMSVTVLLVIGFIYSQKKKELAKNTIIPQSPEEIALYNMQMIRKIYKAVIIGVIAVVLILCIRLVYLFDIQLYF